MQSPVKKEYVTQTFGANPASYSQFGLKGHNGMDFRAFLPDGSRCYEGGKSEVFAPHGGEVIENSYDASGYGNYIKIENDSEGTILAHLHKPSPCAVGSTVKMGQLVGYQGSTGNSTAIHLHWGYYKKPRNRSNGYNGYINQAGLYQPIGEVSMPNEYKGLDLTNLESMKVAVDIWAEVRDGHYVKREECDQRATELESKLNRSIGQYQGQLSKIKPVFEALQKVVQREVVVETDVEPALNAYCEKKQAIVAKEEASNAAGSAVVDGGKEVGRIALFAVYATPISVVLLPLLNSGLDKVGAGIQLDLIQLIPLVTALLKVLDRSIHEYGKLIGNDLVSKALARF